MRGNSEPSGSSLQKSTSWARLDRAFRSVLTVPKQNLPKEEARQKRLSQRKRANRPV
jgi:hypothetical protein